MSMNDEIRLRKSRLRELDMDEAEMNARIERGYQDLETSVGSYGNEDYKKIPASHKAMIKVERDMYNTRNAEERTKLKEALARRDAILKLRRIRQRPLQPQPLHHQNPLQPQNQHHQQVLSPLQFVRLARLSQEE